MFELVLRWLVLRRAWRERLHLDGRVLMRLGPLSYYPLASQSLTFGEASPFLVPEPTDALEDFESLFTVVFPTSSLYQACKDSGL